MYEHLRNGDVACVAKVILGGEPTVQGWSWT